MNEKVESSVKNADRLEKTKIKFRNEIIVLEVKSLLYEISIRLETRIRRIRLGQKLMNFRLDLRKTYLV